MAWTYSSRDDQEYNKLFGDPTKSSKTMRHYKQFLLDSAVERKANWSSGYYDPMNHGLGEASNSRIEEHVKGKYYKVSTQHMHDEGRSTYWLGESKIDAINHRVKELSKGMRHGSSGKGGG